MANRKLGKYEIIERLGRGGMAEVYRAYHSSLDRYVAIKILHTYLADDPEFKTRFEKEAQSVARLKHPNVVQVYDFDYDPEDDSYYMVMELVDGPTVKELLIELSKNSARLPVTETLRIVTEAASALAYAHSQSMIHRDVKPANLILDKGKRVVLTDFGIAKILTGQQHTATGGMVGTPAYMAPEQGMGGTGDERADLYSLGVIFFELLTGRLPYEAETPVAMIMKHVNDPVPSVLEYIPTLPKVIDEIVTRLLAKTPDERYQNVADFIADFKRLRTGRAPSAELAVNQTQPIRNNLLSDIPVTTTPTKLSTHGQMDDDVETVIVTPKPGRQVGPPPELLESARIAPPKRGIPWWWWALSVVGIIIAGASGFFLSDTQREQIVAVAETETPTVTLTFTPTDLASATPTLTVTAAATLTWTPVATEVPTETLTVSPVPTDTPTATLTSTRLPTQTATLVPTHTPTLVETVIPSLTPNTTATVAYIRTATIAACAYDYAIVEQSPADGASGGFFRVGEDYERKITFLNTGNCAWETNTSLTFIEGQNFNIGPRVFIRESVEPAATVMMTINGRLPARGSQTPITGTWELRTPGQIPIGKPLVISIMVFDPGS